MNKTLQLFAIAFLAFSMSHAQTSGGPDLFGYVWRDSNDPNGPAFNWKNISTSGTEISANLTDDNATGPFSLGFGFHYYWNDYSQIKVGSNGWVAFNTNVGNIASSFPNIPTPGGSADNYLAPFMADLNFNDANNPGKVYFWTNNTDSFIVSYETVPYWANASPAYIGSNTFQVICTNTDSSITFQYQSMDAANLPSTPSTNLVIGIENVTGNIGIEHSQQIVPGNGYAIKFYYPAQVTFQVRDITPLWAGNNENQGQFVLANQPVSLQAGVRNVGNTNVTSNIDARAKLQDFQLNTVFSDTVSIASGLNAGTTQVVSYNPYIFPNAGQYTFEVTSATSGGQDDNPSNNINKVEISALTVGPAPACDFQMTYATGQPPSGQISWQGGSGGAGIRIVPPGYPLTVNSIDAFVFGAIDTNQATPLPYGFSIEVWGEDANGNPGTMITSETVTAANATNWAWNTVTLSNPVTINSGGFFVSWITGGDSIFLGTENLAPISRRTYENLCSGCWAPYRNLTQDDFLLRVNASGCSLVTRDKDLIGRLSMQVFPNPSKGLTTVSYELPGNMASAFTLMNLNGQVVMNREFSKMPAGAHVFSFDAAELAPGVYMLRMDANGTTETKKLVITR